MRKHLSTLGLLLGVAATIAFAWYAFNAMQGQDLSRYASAHVAVAIGLAALCYAATLLVSAKAWMWLLSSMGQHKTFRELFRILAISQVGKYVPGNVGAHLGRAGMGMAAGIPSKPLVFSMVLEAGLASVAAVAVGLSGLALSGHTLSWLPLPTPLLLGMVCVVLVSAFLLIPLLRRRISSLPPSPVLTRAFLFYVVVYLGVGTGLWLMALVSLPALSHAPALLCASFALGWLAGFFTPGAPAGLGVREGLMLLVLQGAYSAQDALFLVIAFRLATLAGDAILLLVGSIDLLSARRLTQQPLDREPTMSMNLEPTGERMIEEHYRSSPQDHVIYLLHTATYRFAEAYANNKRVLDYGCGSGYGSAQMAKCAHTVVGVDVADDAVHYATQRFQADNLRYQVIDPSDPLPFEDNSFDTVLSFQVFEHVHDTDRYLAEIRRVLAPGGTLVLATPDRSTRLLPFQRPWNRWHLHEYASDELQDRLRRHFPSVEMLGMGGTPDVLGVEIDRCSKIKWMTLPFTLPVMPDTWRVAALNLIHRIRGAQARTGAPTPCPFTVDDIVIAPGISPSVNLVAVAHVAPVSP